MHWEFCKTAEEHGISQSGKEEEEEEVNTAQGATPNKYLILLL
jgi:hypothetical protein